MFLHSTTLVNILATVGILSVLLNLYLAKVFIKIRSRAVGEFKYYPFASSLCSIAVCFIYFALLNVTYYISLDTEVEWLFWLIASTLMLFFLLSISTFIIFCSFLYQHFSIIQRIALPEKPKMPRLCFSIMRTPGIIALVLIVMIPVFLSTTTLLMKASPNETPILYFVAATISLPRNVSSNCMKSMEGGYERFLLLTLSLYGGVLPCIMCAVISSLQRRQMDLMRFTTFARGVQKMYRDYHRIYSTHACFRFIIFGSLTLIVLDIHSQLLLCLIFIMVPLTPLYEQTIIVYRILSFRRQLMHQLMCIERSAIYQNETRAESVGNSYQMTAF